MQIIHCLQALKTAVNPHRESIALIPTMGALHKGHLSLVEQAQQKTKIVSIFVNPLQFTPDEDFDSYPRTLEQDCEKLKGIADIVYAPNHKTMFPSKQQVGILLPPLADELCGKSRPGFYQGIAIAVSKLIGQVEPSHIYFGEKDYQQMILMRLMIAQLNLPTQLVASPTIREDDGLAYSSRNTYLSASERKIAPCLYQTLQNVAHWIDSNKNQTTDWQALEQKATAQLKAHSLIPDYISIRDADTLQPLTNNQHSSSPNKLIILGAAWLNRTRLLDNLKVGCQ